MGDMMQEIIFVAIGAAITGLLFAVYLTASILRQDEGNERVRFIGNAIRQGAAAFLKREYGVLAVFVHRRRRHSRPVHRLRHPRQGR